MEKSFIDDTITKRDGSHEGHIDTGAFETGSNSYAGGGNVQVNGMIGLFTDESVPVSPNMVVTHHRTRTLNPT